LGVSDKVDRATLAFIEVLKGMPAYVHVHADDPRYVTLDGDFDLKVAMQAAIEAMNAE
jgi:hypothetical protein